jgi:3-hydroxyisobutyrate dehydrogenase
MENRCKTMNEGKFDFGFAVDWMREDKAICANLSLGALHLS